MRRGVVVAVVAAALVALPSGVGAAASPTFRLSIVHFVSGCHVWQTATRTLGPTAKITLKRGTKLEIRDSCPMDFDLKQVAGPKLALGGRLYMGQARVIAFRRAGVYKLTGTNVQSSEQQGLQTLGPDNVVRLTIVVR